MNDGEMLKIVVPGSTANLGPGFDSIGLAVSLHLTLQVIRDEMWEFVPKTSEVKSIPTGESNLIYQVANELARQYGVALPPCRVFVSSNIPFTRGLGSSAAAIVAAIELVNELGRLDLSQEEKMRVASVYEGHPDNVGASLYGGVVIGSHLKDRTHIVHIPSIPVDLIAVIPTYELETKKSRTVLPSAFTREQAVEASAISNVLVAALLTNHWPLVGEMMDADLFHQPYRECLVPELSHVRTVAKQNGAFGVALSGAGPTVLCFAEQGRGKEVYDALVVTFPHCDVRMMSVETKGSCVYKMALEK
ncbi:homoserine kinase [Anoxybacillus sp. D401a]|uniref:homoserine kinase n=1 Tax=Anoxybacillus sp. D401a TaxID=575112 RepID=UPI003D3425C5